MGWLRTGRSRVLRVMLAISPLAKLFLICFARRHTYRSNGTPPVCCSELQWNMNCNCHMTDCGCKGVSLYSYCSLPWTQWFYWLYLRMVFASVTQSLFCPSVILLPAKQSPCTGKMFHVFILKYNNIVIYQCLPSNKFITPCWITKSDPVFLLKAYNCQHQ